MSNIEILKSEFDFYLKNKKSFAEKYIGMYIALKSHQVIYSAYSKEEVLSYMINQGYELGTFLVQHVTLGDEETIQRYYSRVYC